MASLTHESNGRTGWRLRVYDPTDSDRRHSVWLGEMPAREAEKIRRHVEAVVESQKLATPMPGETLRWLSKIDDRLRRKLAPLLGAARTLRQAVAAYLLEVARQHKRSTVEAYADTLRQLCDSFGHVQMRALSAEVLDDWLGGLNTTPNTRAKHAKQLKTFLRWARRQRWVDDLEIRSSSAIGVGKKSFIEVGAFDSLLSHFHDPEMRAALALARWTGMRVPSELLTLQRSHIDWESLRITIVDSKRSKRAARAPPVLRETPMFPELVPLLEAVWPLGEHPTDPLLPGIVAMGGRTFAKRCRAARDSLGLCWPRLFTSLRATRRTELIARFDASTVSEWIGHSPEVSRRNYTVVADETWREATGGSSLP
ncbi:tyrosine-type recombinase/integrase [Aureliella helgolandensis]|uniref:Site-specific tyrosine recombinase XerC n=1 Tax=Aureliella helgolandensis TaxID=2527968 RepID=A0A518G2T7_9BACT|nr:site-specific integrase [Aureliella helgolandensis]QDV22880.1 site-specific tyrosine recombinase XerC [Aureliella helgolandensis]